LGIGNRKRPISEVLKNEAIHPDTRELLLEVPKIKKYGKENGLNISSNYTDYVDLKRKAVIWSVRGCKKLEFKSKTWSFPFVGSFPYLGWFNEESAHDFAKDLEEEGWDVNVRSVTAYSTLGWFSDPIINTMLTEGDRAMGDLVNIVLHESVHATVYVKNQPFFDESIASFIADGLTPGYLEAHFSKGSPRYTSYMKLMDKGRKNRKRLNEDYVKLDRVYKSEVSDKQKLKVKREVFEKIKRDFKKKNLPNNAYLIGFRTYGVGNKEFSALLKACGGNWMRFRKAVSRLNEASFQKENQKDMGPVIMPLVKGGCKG